MIKKVVFITMLLSLTFGTMALAHSGRTDANGGHNCSEKSKAKGLCTGYHYHNGGSTSSGSSESKPAASQPAPAVKRDKDCSDFGSYDEVVEYWNAMGYSATNDPENLDGWGNGVVDDGIPCEAPSGYDRTKINNSPEQVQYNQDQADTSTGTEQGIAQGKEDGYEEIDSDSASAKGSDAYKEGYVAGYDKGYEEGKSKIEKEKKEANENGYTYGQKNDSLKVPDKYSSHKGLKLAYEEGFNKALAERLEADKKKFNKQGFNDGKVDKHSPPSDKDKEIVTSYEEGYTKAQEELKKEYQDKGFEAAFKQVKYKSPEYENDKFTAWFKEGFNSNKKVKEIQKAGFKLGKQGEELSIPSKYSKGENIFAHYYKQGYKEYEEYVQSKKATQSAAAGGSGLLVLGWLGRRFYVAKKMIR
ncbi:YHYH domain-containing protein [Rossellomorea marisflavi]|uniref:YHYH domain-containing protein n=1 Tax=Rossellomorea marisflavi TaxID=189381 RepID=UPI0009A65E45|nr:YHYH domain-containing protein [Rossellomorea marisflavi]